MKDERIEQVKNKIGNEMAIIILCGVAISFLIKTLVFNMSFQERMVEFLILVLSPLYQFVRMHTMKISISSQHTKKNSFTALLIPTSIFLAASALSFFKWTQNPATYNWENPLILLLFFTFLSIIIFLTTNRYDQQRSKKYEQEFNDDNNL